LSMRQELYLHCWQHIADRGRALPAILEHLATGQGLYLRDWQHRANGARAIPAMMMRTTTSTRRDSWTPVPTRAANSSKCRGGRNTSPCTSFHPDSSLMSLSSAWQPRHTLHTNHRTHPSAPASTPIPHSCPSPAPGSPNTFYNQTIQCIPVHQLLVRFLAHVPPECLPDPHLQNKHSHAETLATVL
jgi:hypothetical protein